jgi:hypothetical protein
MVVLLFFLHIKKAGANPDGYRLRPPVLPVSSVAIPIPNQSAIFVGSSSAPQHTGLYAFVASILAALISSLFEIGIMSLRKL